MDKPKPKHFPLAFTIAAISGLLAMAIFLVFENQQLKIQLRETEKINQQVKRQTEETNRQLATKLAKAEEETRQVKREAEEAQQKMLEEVQKAGGEWLKASLKQQEEYQATLEAKQQVEEQLQHVQEGTPDNRGCRRSQMGQTICSDVYTLDGRFLTYVDRAWVEVLGCVERFNPGSNASGVSPPEVHITYLENMKSQCGQGANGCYLPSLKRVVITPQHFDAIYMEYGHHVDYLTGNDAASSIHNWSTYSIQCTQNPVFEWLNSKFSQTFGAEGHSH